MFGYDFCSRKGNDGKVPSDPNCFLNAVGQRGYNLIVTLEPTLCRDAYILERGSLERSGLLH